MGRQLLDDKIFTYGEVTFDSFLPMLSFVRPQRNEIFYDLGCGSGQPLMVASLAFPKLKACRGIELLEGLARLGDEVTGKLQGISNYRAVPCAPITVTQGDIIAENWLDADIIFAASVCFPAELLEAISDKCSQLKKGTRILFMNTLPARPYIHEVASWKGEFTWGLHLIHYYMIV